MELITIVAGFAVAGISGGLQVLIIRYLDKWMKKATIVVLTSTFCVVVAIGIYLDADLVGTLVWGLVTVGLSLILAWTIDETI